MLSNQGAYRLVFHSHRPLICFMVEITNQNKYMTYIESQYVDTIKILFGGSVGLATVAAAAFIFVIGKLKSGGLIIKRPYKRVAIVFSVATIIGFGCSLSALAFLIFFNQSTCLYWTVVAVFCITITAFILGIVLLLMVAL